jgi:hypothetical protein
MAAGTAGWSWEDRPLYTVPHTPRRYIIPTHQSASPSSQQSSMAQNHLRRRSYSGGRRWHADVAGSRRYHRTPSDREYGMSQLQHTCLQRATVAGQVVSQTSFQIVGIHQSPFRRSEFLRGRVIPLLVRSLWQGVVWILSRLNRMSELMHQLSVLQSTIHPRNCALFGELCAVPSMINHTGQLGPRRERICFASSLAGAGVAARLVGPVLQFAHHRDVDPSAPCILILVLGTIVRDADVHLSLRPGTGPYRGRLPGAISLCNRLSTSDDGVFCRNSRSLLNTGVNQIQTRFSVGA